MRREHTAVDEALYPYFQDVYDHILRVSESTDALRDLVSTIVETNLSLRDYRQNQVMKKVTSWAAIVAVPTLVTGYYGMNVPFPARATHGDGSRRSLCASFARSPSTPCSASTSGCSPARLSRPMPGPSRAPATFAATGEREGP